MKLYCFSIYDEKAKAYLPPWFLPTMGMAQRAFADAVNDGTTQFAKHPADYTLFCLGSWNQANAKFDLETAYICVANGLELKDQGLDPISKAFAEVGRGNGVKPGSSPNPEVSE